MKTFLQRSFFGCTAMLLAATSFSQTVIVSKCNMNGWHMQKNNGNSEAVLATDPLQAPGAPGSGKLSVGKNGDSYARFTSGNYYKQAYLNTITELKYSTYVQQNGGTGKAAFILLEVDYDGDAAAEDEWIFEPAYQSTAVSLNSWQSWNALSGKWYTSKGLAGSGPGVKVKSWSALMAAKPAARLLNSHTFKFTAGTKKGPWDNFVGNIDNIIIGVSGQSTTFDLVCDNTGAPVLTCPQPVTLNNDPNSCGAYYTVATPSATDACGNPIASVTGTRDDSRALSDEYPKGTTTITWVATDGAGSNVSCTQTITVVDKDAPQIFCATPVSYERNTDEGVCSYTVKGTEFDATASDNCSFTLTYTLSGATTGSAMSSLNGVVLEKGTTTITWTVDDGSTAPATCHFDITVVDNQPPVLSEIAATPNVLWSPNHKMVDVELIYTVTDNCGSVQLEIAEITSDEHENGLGDGNTDVDWEVIDAHHVRLRAERSGLGDGRVYSIKVKASDDAGNDAYGTVAVSVPHDASSPAEASTLEVITAPNPTENSFIITVNSGNTGDRIALVVSNANGNIIYKRNDLNAGQTINFGESFAPGTYYAEFRQGATVKRVTLLKL